MPTASERRFEFGKNWESFAQTCLDAERITSATLSLRRILAVEDLRGRSFLDVGCGSGLFSLSAALLGAQRVVGFDSDVRCVLVSDRLRAGTGIPAEKWEVRQGSVLDERFLSALDPADVVYAWGVVHHTGAMWRAIDNAVSKVKHGGVIVLAIYNKVDRWLGSSAQWWHVKRLYNRSPRLLRYLMEDAYIVGFIARHALRLREPFSAMRVHGSSRGMEFRHNVRDWVGGFPYECATAGEVFSYVHGKFGLELRYLGTQEGHACNEFVFARVTGE